MLPHSALQDQPRVSGPHYLTEQNIKVGCVPVGPVLGRELQEGLGAGVCLPAVSALREAKMAAEEASGVPGKALHLTVEEGKVWGLSLEEVLLRVQEVGQAPGGQAAEENHQEPVDRALQVLPVLWGGEELRAPQQHHLQGGRRGCGLRRSSRCEGCAFTPRRSLRSHPWGWVLNTDITSPAAKGSGRLLELLLQLLPAQPVRQHPLVLNLCFTPQRAPVSALKQVPAPQQLRNNTLKLSAGTKQ